MQGEKLQNGVLLGYEDPHKIGLRLTAGKLGKMWYKDRYLINMPDRRLLTNGGDKNNEEEGQILEEDNVLELKVNGKSLGIDGDNLSGRNMLKTAIGDAFWGKEGENKGVSPSYLERHQDFEELEMICLSYTSPSPRD